MNFVELTMDMNLIRKKSGKQGSAHRVDVIERRQYRSPITRLYAVQFRRNVFNDSPYLIIIKCPQFSGFVVLKLLDEMPVCAGSE